MGAAWRRRMRPLWMGSRDLRNLDLSSHLLGLGAPSPDEQGIFHHFGDKWLSVE